MAQLNNSSIESVLAWGSVAYALGFVTVMVHTHDYGFPTLQLLDPIYIWIGWPLAAVAFFFYSTSSCFKRVSMEIYQEVRDSIEYLRGSALNETDYLSRLNELEKSLYKMRVIYFINPPSLFILALTKFWTKFYLKLLQRTVEREPDKSEPVPRLTYRLIYMNIIFNRIYIVLTQAFNLIFLAFVIILAILLYVRVLYPEVPQSLGGGRPIPVQFLIDTTKILDNISPIQPTLLEAGDGTAQTQSSDVKLSELVNLLYQDNNAYDVMTCDGTILSIGKDTVKGSIWIDGREERLKQQLVGECVLPNQS